MWVNDRQDVDECHACCWNYTKAANLFFPAAFFQLQQLIISFYLTLSIVLLFFLPHLLSANPGTEAEIT